MYLFTRARTARPSRVADAMAWSTDVVAHASSVGGRDGSVHLALFGRPAGTIVGSVMIEGRAQLMELLETLMGDEEYQRKLGEVDELFVGPPEDALRQIIHLSGMGEDIEPPAYAQAWTAQIAPGQLDHAAAWGMDIADYCFDTTGVPIATLSDCYGDFGQLTWVGAFETAEAVDAANEQLGADPEWIKRLDYADDLFMAGSGRVWLTRRIS